MVFGKLLCPLLLPIIRANEDAVGVMLEKFVANFMS